MKLKVILFFTLGFLFANCSEIRQTEQRVFIVKVAPVYDDNLSQEENYYRFLHFLFPQEEIPNPIPRGLPNDHSLLYVLVNENGKITLNSQCAGDISKTRRLQEQLSRTFVERETNKAYEPGTSKTLKAVGIKSATSIKYGDFLRVVDAVKLSGAEPIVLLFDNDATPNSKRSLQQRNK